MSACKYGDPTCPCQDGDMCHYEGPRPMSVPPEYVRLASFALRSALERIATGDGYYGAQAREYKNIARKALGMEEI